MPASDDPTPLPIDALQLALLPEKGEPPKSRLKDAASAVAVYKLLKQADLPASLNRASVQAMFDGAPPYDEAQLRNLGQAGRCNLNFGEGEELLEQAMAAYVDLLHSVETLITVQTKFGDITQRDEHAQVIAEEFSRMVRAWPGFHHAFLYNCRNFIVDGVSVTLFDNVTTVLAWPGGTVSDIKPIVIELGIVSISGKWNVTTGANVSIVGVGDFT